MSYPLILICPPAKSLFPAPDVNKRLLARVKERTTVFSLTEKNFVGASARKRVPTTIPTLDVEKPDSRTLNKKKKKKSLFID